MPKKKGGHLEKCDRQAIEYGLDRGSSVAEIARDIGVSWSTVSDEIRRHRVRDSDRFKNRGSRNVCEYMDACTVTDLCGLRCGTRCALCAEGCNDVCDRFEEAPDCAKTQRAPWCCNGCGVRLTVGCHSPQWFYDAPRAQAEADWALVTSRNGVDCTPDQLRELVERVRPLLKKGQSPQHIWQTHPGEFPVSCRTFYRYVEAGVLDIINLELPKKVKYKPRRRGARDVPFRPNLLGRTYADFLALDADDQAGCVEMDCVESGRGSAKTILTLLFRRYLFQLMVLLEAQTQEQVRAALDRVELAMGAGGFRTHAGVVLTDRGHEFLDVSAIEGSVAGGERCSVFYCDPLMSGQKGRCEKAHVELRKVLPKGSCFEALDEAAVSAVCSHVNSYGRPQLGGASPISLAKRVLPEGLFAEFGVVEVPPEEVVMRPSLLRSLGYL